MNSTAVWFVQKKSPIQWLTLIRKPSISTEDNEDWRRQISFCNRWPLQTSTEILTRFHIICIQRLNNKWTMIPKNRQGLNEQLENTILILSKPQMTNITERYTSSIEEQPPDLGTSKPPSQQNREQKERTDRAITHESTTIHYKTHHLSMPPTTHLSLPPSHFIVQNGIGVECEHEQ